jgi:hypothetical protein
MARTGLQEFRKVWTDVRDLSALAVKGTIAAPAINLWVKLGPPPTPAVSALTSVAAFLSVIYTFHFWFSLARKKLDTRMRICLITFCIALASSAMLLEVFTLGPPHRDRIVTGYSLRPDVKPVIKNTFTARDALQGAEYDPYEVWTRASIAVVHVALVTCWIITFVALSVFLSSFVIVQRRFALSGSDAGKARHPAE